MAEEMTGAANPRALVEQVLGRPVAWDSLADREGFIENVLGVEYNKLFDSKYDSPVYLGLRRAPNGQFARVRPSLDEIRSAPVGSLRQMSINGAPITFDSALYATAMRQLFNPAPTNGDTPWNPPGVTWRDPGDFFREACEFFDPDQGAVGDCYFIAALAAVAWARPFLIAHRTRATGDAQDKFNDRVTFYGASKSAVHIEVTERMPLNSGGHMIYAKSTEPGEIWPAVYEKAYAKWKTGTTTDQPDYNEISGGNPATALTEISGLTHTVYNTASKTAAALYAIVKSNCTRKRTHNPMVTWTYHSADAAPTAINYGTANLVARHAYTVLGIHEEAGREYIVLRNPWGWKDGTLTADSGVWITYDISWWRSVNLDPDDGVFAIDKATFQSYFARLAVAS